MKVLKVITGAIIVLILLCVLAFAAAGLAVQAEASFVNDVEINAPVERVWYVVTDKGKYTEWQTNLSRVEITDEENWVEYPKDSPEPLKFSLATDARPEWMEFHYTMGDTFSGHWKGEATSTSAGTHLKTTDSYKADGWVTKILIWLFFDYDLFAKDWNKKLKAQVENLSR